MRRRRLGEWVEDEGLEEAEAEEEEEEAEGGALSLMLFADREPWGERIGLGASTVSGEEGPASESILECLGCRYI